MSYLQVFYIKKILKLNIFVHIKKKFGNYYFSEFYCTSIVYLIEFEKSNKIYCKMITMEYAIIFM